MEKLEIPSFKKFLNQSDNECKTSKVKESDELDAQIEKDTAEIKEKILNLQDMISDAELHEEDFIEYITDKIDTLKDELADLLDEDEDGVKAFLNENYNAGELTDVLIAIKNGKLKTLFDLIKQKDNVIFMDVAKVLIEKNKPEYLLRLIEMATAQGYLKI